MAARHPRSRSVIVSNAVYTAAPSAPACCAVHGTPPRQVRAILRTRPPLPRCAQRHLKHEAVVPRLDEVVPHAPPARSVNRQQRQLQRGAEAHMIGARARRTRACVRTTRQPALDSENRSRKQPSLRPGALSIASAWHCAANHNTMRSDRGHLMRSSSTHPSYEPVQPNGVLQRPQQVQPRGRRKRRAHPPPEHRKPGG